MVQLTLQRTLSKNTPSAERRIQVLTQNQIKIQYLIQRYRWRHKGDKKANDALDRILWYSYPIVYSREEQAAVVKAIDRRKAKKKRTNRYLADMAKCYDDLYFLTLTWRDEHLDGLSERTRHRYVARFLEENTRDYYANQDFGSRTEREHFHAVVALKSEMNKWPYGFAKLKAIKRPADSTTRHKLATYLLKLVNHAGKATTGKAFHKRGYKEVDNLPF